MDGREVLSQGIIRRIGTGETTEIWASNWLPRDGLLRPMATAKPNPPKLVCELINQSMACWDRQKLEQFFNPMDIETIYQIPLTTRRQEDFWAWYYEKRGFFSVRSAYRMLVSNKERGIRHGWTTDQESLITNQRKGNGKHCGRFRCHQKLKSSYGVWLGNPSPLEMFYTTGRWPTLGIVCSVAWPIHGGTLFLSATWQNVYGPERRYYWFSRRIAGTRRTGMAGHGPLVVAS